MALAYLAQAGFHSMAIDASELLYYQQSALDGHTLLIVISQSGYSAEICKLLNIVAGRIPILGITNTPDSPLAQQSTLLLRLQAGVEYAASTKTYLCSLAVLYLLINALCGTFTQGVATLRWLSDYIEQSLPLWQAQTESTNWALNYKGSIMCIGRGPSFSTACASGMLFQEVAKIPAYGITAGNFRHGPIEALSSNVGYVTFESLPPTLEFDLKLARQMSALGSPARGNILMIGTTTIDEIETISVQVEDNRLQPLLAILPLQWLSLHLAINRQVASDSYQFAQKITNYE